MVLLATNIFITVELATGYVSKTWDDRMLILVSISSCLITVGQTLSKTAFAVTLLRITESWQRCTLWVIIVSLNLYLVILLFLNWVDYCGQKPYWWKMPGVCAPYETIFQIKIGQNGESLPTRASCRAGVQTFGANRSCARSVQHCHRLRAVSIPMAGHMEAEDREIREGWPLRGHEPGYNVGTA